MVAKALDISKSLVDEDELKDSANLYVQTPRKRSMEADCDEYPNCEVGDVLQTSGGAAVLLHCPQRSYDTGL